MIIEPDEAEAGKELFSRIDVKLSVLRTDNNNSLSLVLIIQAGVQYNSKHLSSLVCLVVSEAEVRELLLVFAHHVEAVAEVSESGAQVHLILKLLENLCMVEVGVRKETV